MLALALAVTLSAAPEAGFQVYPVKGIFFPPAQSDALIDPDFRAALDAAAGARFERRFREVFPAAAAAFTDANKRRTFAVSLQVARASVYSIRKPLGTTDVYLPMTASLYFTNALTGEVLLALTRTDIPVKSIASGANSGSDHVVVQDLFRRFFPSLIDELIDQAHQRFHPMAISATVRGEWQGLAILDSGSERGLVPGDSLIDAQGNVLSVVASGASFAFASIDLGHFSRGAEFKRLTTQTLAELRKPRALVFVDGAPSDLPPETLVQLFGDALGEGSPVNLIPVNRSFAQVLQALASSGQVSQQELRAREWPELFVRLHVAEPTLFETAGGRATQRRRISEGLAYLEVQDRGGRVLFATQGQDHIQDEILVGVAFANADRREIAVKNTLLDLAKKLAAGLKLSAATLSIIAASGDEVTLSDPSGLLASGTPLRVQHPIGGIGGIAGEVRAPTWDLEVFESQNGKARARLVLPVVAGAPKPTPGDSAVVHGVKAAPTQRRVGPCAGSENLGSLEIAGYEPLALNLFAASFPGNFYSPGLPALTGQLVNEGTGFKSGEALREPSFDLCVQPVYRITPKERRCGGDDCVETDAVATTYRLRQGGAGGSIVLKKGLETEMRGTPLPPSTSPADVAAARRIDLLDEVMHLDAQIAASLSEVSQ